MKKHLFIMIIFGVMAVPQLFASHIAALVLSYKYIGNVTNVPGQYVIMIEGNGLQSGIAWFPTIDYYYQKLNCPGIVDTASVSSVVSPLVLINDTAANLCQNLYAMKKYIYLDTITFTAQELACGLKFFIRNEMFRVTYDNLLGLDKWNMYAECILNPTTLPAHNNSFKMNGPKFRFVPVGRYVAINQFFTDPDGDSLYISKADVRANATTNILYSSANYITARPLDCVYSIGYNLIEENGALWFYTNTVGWWCVGLRVEEYRKHPITNVPYLVATSTLDRGIASMYIDSAALGNLEMLTPTTYLPCNTKTFEVFTNLEFFGQSLDSKGSDFVFRDSNQNVVPILSIVPTNPYGAMNASFLVTLADSIPNSGRYTLVAKKGTDHNTMFDECGRYLAVNDSISIVVHCSGIGIVADEIEKEMEIYPNPAQDFVTIKWKETSKPKSIKLCDLQGRVLLNYQPETNSQQETIDISTMPIGVYYLQFFGPEGTNVHKLLKTE